MKRKNVKCKYCKKNNSNGESYCNFECRMKKYTLKKENGCWDWIGSKDKHGYGQFCIKANNNPKQRFVFAHRESYKFYKSKLSDDFVVCHHCDNPSCINPDHLWAGTQTENHKDMHNKGREGHGSAKGENTPVSKLKNQNITEIRSMYENGKSQQKIADIFGVTQGTISSILRKATWKHIE